MKNTYNNKYLLDKFLDLHFENWPDIIVLEKVVVKSFLMIYINRNV